MIVSGLHKPIIKSKSYYKNLNTINKINSLTKYN